MTRHELIVLSLSVSLISSCIVVSGTQEVPEVSSTLQSMERALAAQSTEIAKQATMISYLATRGPAPLLPTPATESTPYYPVIGSVIIEDGSCCAGGLTGETIELQVRFDATSPFGQITHMRFHAGSGPLRAEQLGSASAWENFTKSRTLVVPVSLNWTGYYITVQYRDSAGNLSGPVWDDISIEGQPAPTP